MPQVVGPHHVRLCPAGSGCSRVSVRNTCGSSGSAAVAIARVTAREPGLPLVRLAVGEAADIRALLDYREQLRAERTRMANRTHVELSSLRPGYQAKVPNLTQAAH